MNVISYDVARERMTRGVALLDERSPGWWRTLVPESVDMRYYDQCVVGSINPEVGYAAMAMELGLSLDSSDLTPKTVTPDSVVWYGFNLLSCETAEEDDGESYARLTDVWRQLIAGRQVEAGLR